MTGQVTNTYRCIDCGAEFQHPKQRGRPPTRCVKHRAKPVSKKVKAIAQEVYQAGQERAQERAQAVRNLRTKNVICCGACGGAPMSTVREADHMRCPGAERCACAAADHRPTPEVRSYQAAYCQLSVADCIERDPGLVSTDA